MIKLVEKTDESITAFAGTDCLGVRILGPVSAYGTGFDFLQLWVQESDKITAVISKFYGGVTVHASPDADTDEIDEFLSVIGYTSLLKNYGEGNRFVMHTKDVKESPVTNCNCIANSNFRDFYGIISECHGNFPPEDFDSWYVDINHRIRHGTAATYLLEAEGVFVSAAAALSITENAVFISAVSTLPEYRGRHYAHTLLSLIAKDYPDKDICLFCKEKNLPFYEKIGFTNTSKIFMS